MENLQHKKSRKGCIRTPSSIKTCLLKPMIEKVGEEKASGKNQKDPYKGWRKGKIRLSKIKIQLAQQKEINTQEIHRSYFPYQIQSYLVV